MAKAAIQYFQLLVDSGLRRNDGFGTFYDSGNNNELDRKFVTIYKKKFILNQCFFLKLRVHEEINLHFQKSRRQHGKARGERIAGYSNDEQHRQAGCIGLLKCEVIFE